MEAYKRASHTVWDCKYHLVWVTKYRHQVLGGDVGQRCRELLRETARAHEMVVHAGSINRDHVHMLLSIPPKDRALADCFPTTFVGDRSGYYPNKLISLGFGSGGGI